ncbi:MAG: alpha-amylase family glycosyl hydrolase [Ignavibacterium sp.]|nr:alpha-amylase family glycosyl hydrolase [Ignavibacterium sp.]MDW8375798.1 alpha-amylase family glycosyl hydrolase [Ignavibacteriales bacterium]
MIYNNPRILEINTRVWLRKKNLTSIKEIPDSQIEEWKDLGFDYIWFMGIWKINKDIVSKYCFEPGLVATYNEALKDWKKEDVIGSPYAISEYTVNPEIGTEEDLLNLKQRLNSAGIKLIVDFVSNHFSIGSELLKTNKDLFVPADEYFYKNDPLTYFQSPYDPKEYYAHGRDPLFLAWQDTVQINYFNPNARKFMIDILNKITSLADGVRCDMAMLTLNNIFYNTWIGPLRKYGFEKPEKEFWYEAIASVKIKRPDFVFIAEAYWNLEWQLQLLGFDFTYDKTLLDRLVHNEIQGVKYHLKADEDFQKKSVRFIENHDELRAAANFGKDRSMAAAVVISTIRGMIFYHDGQFEGKKIKLPVQLRREQFEKIDERIQNFYYKLLRITKAQIFRLGSWEQLEPTSVHEKDNTFENIFVWQWIYKNDSRLVAINFSPSTARCRVKFKVPQDKMILNLYDELNSVSYERSVQEINEEGLFIELKAFSSHIFAFNL